MVLLPCVYFFIISDFFIFGLLSMLSLSIKSYNR